MRKFWMVRVGDSATSSEPDRPDDARNDIQESQLGVADVCFILGLVSAFFTGYLRDHYGGIISYGLTDGLLGVAFFLAIVNWGPRKFFAQTPLTTPLMLLLVLSVPSAFNPEAHALEGLLGLRAWNFYNLVFFYTYLRVQNQRAIHRLVTLLLVIGVLVAAYGMYQLWIGPEKFVEGSRLIEERHKYEAYSIFPEEDVQIYVFRPFSTLHSAGGLGSAMFGLSLLAMSFALREGRGRAWRVPIGLAVFVLFGAMLLLTGSRASVLAYVLGTLTFVALQRRVSRALLIVLLAVVALYGAVDISAGAILGRLETLNPAGAIGTAESNWQTVMLKRIQNNMGWVVGMMNNPLGLGVGTTGVGIPTLPGVERWGFRGTLVDSDLGRAAVEMGIPGFLVVGYLVGAMVFHAARIGNRLRNSPFEALASSLAGIVVGSLPLILLGSPLYGPPISFLIWSSLGALLKLEILANQRRVPAHRLTPPTESYARTIE